MTGGFFIFIIGKLKDESFFCILFCVLASFCMEVSVGIKKPIKGSMEMLSGCRAGKGGAEREE